MEDYQVVVEQRSGSIQCDFEKAKAYLAGRLEEYKGILFTEETRADAKASVASLRKEQKAFSDRVKEVKKEYMVPFDKFAAQAMELIEMYEEPIHFINEQIKDFDKKRVEEKKKLISELYAECICEIHDMSDILPLQKIYNPKWENATVSPKAIRAEMMTKKEEAKKAVETIREMHSDMEEKAIAMYRDTLDLTACILFINRYEAQKKEILEQQREQVRREEEERIRDEERRKLEEERRAQEEKEAALRRAEEEKQEALRRAEAEKVAAVEQAREEAAQEVIDSLIPDSTEGEADLYEYRISLTTSEKEKLEMYMDSVGIEWEEI